MRQGFYDTRGARRQMKLDIIGDVHRLRVSQDTQAAGDLEPSGAAAPVFAA